MNIMKFKYLSIAVLAILLVVTSCVNDLDTVPIDKDVITSETVYEKPENYIHVLAKLYAGLAVSGQEGPSGNNDLSGLDEGFGQYLRALWYAEELPTDEAVIGWNDATIRDFHDIDWSADDNFIRNLYSRIFYQVSLCNEFIRETTEEKLNSRGIEGAVRTDIAMYRAEARFLRALSYSHAIDLFGNVPFVTEEDNVGSFFPEQISRADLFDYVESELLAIESELAAPRSIEYGRADQASVWMVLAKLYLNAEVYIGQDKYTESLTYTNKIINAGYTLEPEYTHLFMADNHKSNEIIFPVIQDGVNIRNWGGTTFLVHAPVGGSMVPEDFGIDGGWSGLRVTKEFVGKFLDLETLTPKIKSAKATADYPVIYVPGGYQSASGYGGDWSPDVAPMLGAVNSDDNYEGYVYFADAAEFKFTAGPNWDVNWGDNGGDGILDPGGANLSVTEAGYYKMNVNIADLTYTITKTDWGIIGSATAGGWDSDQNMEFDAASKTWVAEIDLAAGEIKFRANDDWGINYGDDGADGVLEAGAANIAIAEGGSYKITMKLENPDYTYTVEKYSSDGRGLFYTDGQNLEIENLFEFTDGYAITKWKNVTSTGETGSDLTHPDTDFPMFRLADAYLMYAEAVVRGGSGGSMSTAVDYVNMVRERAYGDDFGNITASDLTLDFILDERARELYWEGQRRTDLIRFGKFTGSSYLWAWKGAVKEGKSVDDKYRLYPIPETDLTVNQNLTQNPGY
ncbi:RagB/SusD family nutrient uptake outer membrane protein [Maribellus sediminis]|uniref:RagB/SusD family nutrient uptake outer membrane protein n=1 Tax=Maribellus sediminis TaxID=2696285 RepID=UPI0014306ABE|nr:RagB/SusD family nutrient uptake outer membrane protein [Maribellus sediminis]